MIKMISLLVSSQQLLDIIFKPSSFGTIYIKMIELFLC